MDPLQLVARHAERMSRMPSRAIDAEIEIRRSRGERVLDLKPYPVRSLPDHVLVAIERAAREGTSAASRGLPDLREAVAAKVLREHRRRVDADSEVLITNGGMHALNLLFRAILEPGDEVLIPSPCFFFGGAIELAGGVPVYVPMSDDQRYGWDVDRIAARVTPRSKILLVSSPVNPTGQVLDAADLEGLARVADEANLLVVSDESYDQLVFDGRRHLSPFSWPGLAARTVLVQSVTKSYAMPSWRVGYLVGSERLVETALKMLEWEVLSCGGVAQAAAAAALSGSQDWLEGASAEFASNRDQLLSRLSGHDRLRWDVPEGGPFVYFETKRYGIPSTGVARELLRRGVPSVPAEAFMDLDHVRIAIGGSPAIIDELADALLHATRL